MAESPRDFLIRFGAQKQPHSGRVFLDHLEGTAAIVKARGFGPNAQNAALFHSVYGTEFFTPAVVPTRAEVRAVIGNIAELLAWLFCNMRRNSLRADGTHLRMRDGSTIPVHPENRRILFGIVEANAKEQRAHTQRVAYPAPAAGRYSFKDTSGLIARDAATIDLRIMPRRMDEPVYVSQMITPSQAAWYSNIVRGMITAGQLEQSKTFSADSKTLTTNSNVRRSYNLTIPQNMHSLYGAMDQEGAKAMQLFRNWEFAPRRSGEQLLAYEKGGYFSPHADNTIGRGGKLITNTPLRQMVGLLWLHDSTPDAKDSDTNKFSGGELILNNLFDTDGKPYTITPKAGMFAAFPAHMWYMHSVAAVGAGWRVTATRWWEAFK